MALSKEELDTLAVSLDEEKKLKKDYLDFLASDAVLPVSEEKATASVIKPSTISAPKGDTFLTRNALITLRDGRTIISPEESAARQREKFKSKLPKVLREVLFGYDKKVKPVEPTLEQNFRQSVAQGMRQFIADEGLVGLLAPEMTKPKETRMFDIIHGLSSRGIDTDRAEQISLREVFGEGDVSMTGEEKVKLGNLKTERNAMLVLDALDLFPAWKALKSGATVALEQTVKEAMEQSTRKGMRDVIERDFIRFKNTSNVDDIIDVIEKTKVLDDSKKMGEIEKAVSEANNSLEIRKEILTRAQRIEYDNGVPVVRTAPDTVASTIRLRKYITDTLQSMREQYRLSNPDIFAKEMRAGSLVREATPDGTIDVFSLGSGAGKIGENVTVSKTLAEAKGITPKTITVKVDDLVRLPDGTFTIAPKASLAPDMTPAIQGVRKEIQGTVAAAEKRAVQAAQKQKAAQVALEKSKRLADEQEVARLAKEDVARVARETAKKTEAQKTIKDTPMQLAQRKADVDIEATRKKAEVQKTIKDTPTQLARKKADVDVETARKKAEVDKLESDAKILTKTIGGKLAVVNKSIQAIKRSISSVEKAIAKAKKTGSATKRLKNLLEKAQTNLKKANIAKRSLVSEFNKATKSIPTNTKVKKSEIDAKAKIQKVKLLEESKKAIAKVDSIMEEIDAKAKIRKAELLEESKKAVTEAKATLREIEDANKTSVLSTRQAERLQAKVDKLENKKTKLIKAYGRLEEVPEDKIKEIDDAIAELKKSEVEAPAVKESVDSAGVAKTTTVATKTDEVATAKIKPVRIEGTEIKTSTLMKRLTDKIKNAPYSPEYNSATAEKQLQNAFDHIAKNGIDDTLKLLESGVPPVNTTKARLASALIESIEEVTDPALKLNYTNRFAASLPELSEFGTRAGQEIEAFKSLHKNNPVMRVIEIQRQLSSKANVEKTAKEVAKIEKRLENIDTKSIINEGIDKFTC